MGRILHWLALVALLGAVPARADPPPITSAAPDKVAVTLYRAPDRDAEEAMDLEWLQGYALVTEQRTVDVPAGPATVRFEGVAGGMLPESALVTGLPDGVREKNLDADLLSPASIYARSTGRPVILRRTDGRTGKVTEERAVIRSGPEGAAVLQVKDGFLAVDCGPQTEELVYTELPPGLSARPTLSIGFDSPVAQRVTISLSYLAWGFDWQTNYVVTMPQNGRKAEMTAWVTMASSDPTSFPNAQAALVGGKVNREDERGYEDRPDGELTFKCFARPGSLVALPGLLAPTPVSAMDSESMDIVVTAQRRVELVQNSPLAITVTEESLGDLRLYRVPIPTTVAANAQKQVALFDRKLVDVSIVYAVRAQEDYADDPQLQLRTRNRKQEGLGLALPGGPVTVFEPHDGQAMLIGEGGLADKAVGEDVEIRLGEATQVQFETDEVDSGDNWSDYEYTATNANPWPITLEVLLTHDPARKLSRASAKLGRKDGWPTWLATVPANGEAKLRFRLKEAQEEDEEEEDDD